MQVFHWHNGVGLNASETVVYWLCAKLFSGFHCEFVLVCQCVILPPKCAQLMKPLHPPDHFVQCASVPAKCHIEVNVHLCANSRVPF